MMILIRWVFSMGLAGTVTFALFFFMQALIASGSQLTSRINIIKSVDASMPDIELEIIEEIDRPEIIQTVDDSPPDVPEKRVNMDAGPSLNISKDIVVLDASLNIGNASISITDGEMLPLVAVTPTYPTRAASRGIEGWCLVSFTVSGTGAVIEETITVLDAEPPNVFNRSSVRAARRFKFQPRVVNGEGMPVSNVRYLFTYQLEGER